MNYRFSLEIIAVCSFEPGKMEEADPLLYIQRWLPGTVHFISYEKKNHDKIFWKFITIHPKQKITY